jgi:hypothetical protein
MGEGGGMKLRKCQCILDEDLPSERVCGRMTDKVLRLDAADGDLFVVCVACCDAVEGQGRDTPSPHAESVTFYDGFKKVRFMTYTSPKIETPAES